MTRGFGVESEHGDARVHASARECLHSYNQSYAPIPIGATEHTLALGQGSEVNSEVAILTAIGSPIPRIELVTRRHFSGGPPRPQETQDFTSAVSPSSFSCTRHNETERCSSLAPRPLRPWRLRRADPLGKACPGCHPPVFRQRPAPQSKQGRQSVE